MITIRYVLCDDTFADSEALDLSTNGSNDTDSLVSYVMSAYCDIKSESLDLQIPHLHISRFSTTKSLVSRNILCSSEYSVLYMYHPTMLNQLEKLRV